MLGLNYWDGRAYCTLFTPPPQILHNHSFQSLLSITVVPREIENNGHAELFFLGGGGGGLTRVYYGLCEKGKTAKVYIYY